MLPILLIVLLAFAGLLLVRLGASERRQIARRWPAFALAGIAALALSRGAYALALLAACLAGLAWAIWPRLTESQRKGPPSATEEAAARALLGLGADATAAEIRAAYRSRMARAHPDRGGSHDLAARLTAARDLLLRRKR